MSAQVDPRELERALKDPFAIGAKGGKAGKGLYRVTIDLYGHASSRATFNVWAPTEDEAKELAEDAAEGWDAEEVDWDQMDSRCVVLRESDADLSLIPSWAAKRGQVLLGESA